MNIINNAQIKFQNGRSARAESFAVVHANIELMNTIPSGITVMVIRPVRHRVRV